MKLINKYYTLLIILFSIVLNSCSDKILYFRDLTIPNEILRTSYQPHTLKPYDYLYISIQTTDQDVNQLFSNFLQQNRINLGTPNNQSSYFLTGFMVNDSGYIYLPIFGSFYAQGKTVEQLQNDIQRRVDSILNDAVVKVKLISFQIFFIGEVNSSITFYKDHVNILEAISQVGGLPTSADKKNLYILRYQDTAYKVIKIDLTSKKILENKEFYLEPYDIVYVKPRASKIWQIQIQDYFIFASLISSAISLTSLILTIFLTRK